MSDKTIEQLAAEEIEAMKPEAAPKGTDEQAIAEKVKAGLTRAQAIEVLQAQAAHDASLAPAEKKAAKGK